MTDHAFARGFAPGHDHAASARVESEVMGHLAGELGIMLPSVYAALNRTAVLFQELQRDTHLNAEELLTLTTIATANLQRSQRTAGTKGATLSTVNLVPASQSAVARATCTPRQTMRRRLEKLSAMGAVCATEQGLILNFENEAVLKLLRGLTAPASVPGTPPAALDAA